MKTTVVLSLAFISLVLAFPAQDSREADSSVDKRIRQPPEPCWPFRFGLGPAIPPAWFRGQNSSDVRPHITRPRICGWPVIQNGTIRAPLNETVLY
ncbi:uncharacterized protein LOC120429281 [Culex pipiens pallens]|uniref:uncharacterized protein LOC120429281 n=1 Tax=Culex pipiens pallens TaxID=42434 RepID=UPI001953A5D4|nr:uncharacterized protein LOC120429281 [Culex pipiens pallens]